MFLHTCLDQGVRATVVHGRRCRWRLGGRRPGLRGGRDLDQASGLDVVDVAVDRDGAFGTSGWWRMRATSSTTLCSRSAIVSQSMSSPAAEPAPCRRRVNPSGPARRSRGSARADQRITSLVKDSMPQSVWWITNHSLCRAACTRSPASGSRRRWRGPRHCGSHGRRLRSARHTWRDRAARPCR